jgi:arylamine N-acetyltransferase
METAAYLRRIGVDDPGPPSAAALAALHRAHVERVPYAWLSSASESPFVQSFTAQRRDAHGVDAVIGSALHHFPDGEPVALDTQDDWVEVLRDRFGIELDAAERDALWARVQYSR